MRKLTLVLAIIGPLCFFACEGPEGPAGPQGQAGTQGTQGVQGIQGSPAGALQYKLNKGLTTSADGAFGIYLDLSADAASKANDGVVLLYMQINGYWHLFPATLQHAGNAYSYSMKYKVESNRLNIEVNRLQTTGVSNNVTVAFENGRIVIVPAMNARINYEDYQGTMNALGLEN